MDLLTETPVGGAGIKIKKKWENLSDDLFFLEKPKNLTEDFF